MKQNNLIKRVFISIAMILTCVTYTKAQKIQPLWTIPADASTGRCSIRCANGFGDTLFGANNTAGTIEEWKDGQLVASYDINGWCAANGIGDYVLWTCVMVDDAGNVLANVGSSIAASDTYQNWILLPASNRNDMQFLHIDEFPGGLIIPGRVDVPCNIVGDISTGAYMYVVPEKSNLLAVMYIGLDDDGNIFYDPDYSWALPAATSFDNSTNVATFQTFDTIFEAMEECEENHIAADTYIRWRGQGAPFTWNDETAQFEKNSTLNQGANTPGMGLFAIADRKFMVLPVLSATTGARGSSVAVYDLATNEEVASWDSEGITNYMVGSVTARACEDGKSAYIYVAGHQDCFGILKFTLEQTEEPSEPEQPNEPELPEDTSGLSYNIISDTDVEVIAGAEKYSGDIIIPSQTVIDGKVYNVTKIGDNAFSGCSGLTSVTIPNNVTSIGISALYGCSGLTSITIPNSVTSIGNSAFFECSGLTYVTIPNSVTSIGEYAFSGCSGLTSVTIGNSVTSIGEFIFGKCDGLKSIIVKSGNSKYDSRNNCNAIIETSTNILLTGCKNTIIPNSVTSIGDYAFYGCSGLTNINIPNSVTSIGEYAFYGCSGLTSVMIGNSVTNIGDYAFYGCSGLTSVTSLNPTPPTCGTDIFVSNATLMVLNESISLYQSSDTWKDFGIIKGIGELPEDTSGLSYNIISETQVEVVAGAEKYSGDIVIPSQTAINGKAYNVIKIGNTAFYACDNLTSITIPESITSIGDNAFDFCSSLESIIVESDNTIYDSRNNCNAIIETSTNSLIFGCKNTTIPNSVTSIGQFAFYYCDFLTNITIPNSVTSIGSSAFSGCSGLASIIIPEGVTSIGDGAFSSCSGLTSVTIPDGVTSIGSSAFRDCSSLTSVTIGNSVTNIGNWAFHGCNGLTSVTSLNPTPPTCGTDIFVSNATLMVPNESISLYKSADIWKDFGIINGIGELEPELPEDTSGLSYNIISQTEVEVVAGAEKYSGDIVIPSQTAINGKAYNVIKIGNTAFYACDNLTSITIPESITSIGDNAFYNCSGLTSVTSLNPTPPTCGINIFYNVSVKNISIEVPSESISLYKSADTWKDFMYATDTTVYYPKITRLLTIPADVSTGYCSSRTGNGFGETFFGSNYQAGTIDEWKDGELVASYDINGWCAANEIGETIKVKDETTGEETEKFATYVLWSSVMVDDAGNILANVGTAAGAASTCQNWILLPASNRNDMQFLHIDEFPGNVTKGRVDVSCNIVGDISTGAYMYIAPTSSRELALMHIRLDVNGKITYDLNKSWSLLSTTAFDSSTNVATFKTYDDLKNAKSKGEVAADTYIRWRGQGAPFTWNAETAQFEKNVTLNQGAGTPGMGVFAIANRKFMVLPVKSATIGTRGSSVAVYDLATNEEVASWDSEGAVDYYAGSVTARTNENGVSANIYVAGHKDCFGILKFTLEETDEPSEPETPSEQPSEPELPEDTSGLSYNIISDTDVEVTAGREKYSGDIVIPTQTAINGKAYNVTSIGYGAFSHCSGLTSVTIPNSVTSIGEWAFDNCSSLTSVTIPNSVTSIGGSAFSGCSGLTSVTIGNNVTSIGNYAFFNCYSLTGALELPNSIESIGTEAFYYTNYKICNIKAQTPPTLGSDAMPSSLSLVLVPAESVKAYKADEQWSKYTIIGEGACDIEVTNETAGQLSRSIYNQAQKNLNNITGLTVHGTLNADDIEKINSNMTSLLHLDISDTDVTEIPTNAFKDKKTLLSVKLPNGLTTIGDYAFSGTYLSEELVLPETLETIGNYAFQNCSMITDTLKFNSNLKQIGRSCFNGCKDLKAVDMSAAVGLESLSEYAFNDCSNLETIKLNNTLKSIGYYTFNSCSKLGDIEFPATIEKIDDYAFSGCKNLKMLELSNCESLTSISNYAFKNCSSIETVNFPSTLASIGTNAFANCTNLLHMSVPCTTPPAIANGADPFAGVDNVACILSIPTESFFDYWDANYWGGFVDIENKSDIQIEVTNPEDDDKSGNTNGCQINYHKHHYDKPSHRALSLKDIRASLTEEVIEKVDDKNKALTAGGQSVFVGNGDAVTFYFTPEDGKEIDKVLFNGEDVTSELVNNTYTTSAVTEMSSLQVILRQGTLTEIEETLVSEEGEVEYYNLQGVKVVNPSSGLYIKKQGNKVTKVIL